MYRTESVVACDTCGLVQRVDALGHNLVAECARCDSFLMATRDEGRLHLTAALALGALQGGVEFATPSAKAPRVKAGTVFFLHDAPKEEWLDWEPHLKLAPEKD